MAQIKTGKFLPEVFNTETNQKFLNATLDQLVTKPDLKNVNGYIGRKFAPTFRSTDNYQPEPSTERQNYQLEPSVVVKNPITNKTEFFSSYIDLLNQIGYNGGFTNNQDRLFANESYSFDGNFDFDKLINFNQYYWLPNGPDPVQVYGTQVPSQQTFIVTRNPSTGSYMFSTKGGVENPTITLAYGGTYQFVVNQVGYPLWLQTNPGTNGLKSNQTNLSSRDILGVTNNGTDVGTITFSVPQPNAQDYYLRMPLAGTADLSTLLHYNQVQGQRLSTVVNLGEQGFDGVNSVNQLNLKSLIFVNTNDIDSSFWTVNGNTVPVATRRNAWQILLVPVYANDNVTVIDYTVTLNPTAQTFVISANQKVFVQAGISRAEYTYYLANDYLSLNILNVMPNITAAAVNLFYQDGVASEFVGQINLVALNNVSFDVDTDIVGRKTYKSPNGVTFTNGLKVQFDSSALPATYAGNTYYVEGVGTGIQLINVNNFYTPEQSAYATSGLSSPDYITINRASLDSNPWSRSNRWFHADIINATASYNNTIVNFDQTIRANRPIIEYTSNLQLMNFGRVAKTPVNLLVLAATDALNTIELAPQGTQLNGVTLTQGMRIIFANDYDPTIKNQILVVNIVQLLTPTPGYFINLVPADDAQILPYNNVVVLQGPNIGLEYYFNGSSWLTGQAKTQINQYPLFDVIDQNGTSISEYAGSTFAGTEIFSYSMGTGVADPVLGFALSYRNFNQIGDIQFTNNFDSDVFSYTGHSNVNINTAGTLQQNTGLTTYDIKNNWITNTERTKQFQIISGVYDGVNPYFKIDINPDPAVTVPYLRVYKNAIQSTLHQQITIGVNRYVHIIDPTLTAGDQIDILIYNSTAVSQLGYYEVPENLDYNSKNADFGSLTLGQLRNHLTTMVSNSNQIIGLVPGNSNLRDVPIKVQGGSILQHSAPLLYSELFLVDQDANFIKGLALARNEYTKIKNKILELSTRAGYDYTDIPALLDALLKSINSVKNNSFAWYYSDMVPYGDAKNIITYTILSTEIVDYELSNVFSDTTLSNTSVLVYLNGVQLVKGTDYVFDLNRAGVTILVPLAIGDILTIYEYSNTDGNYIPETPTKLGLYPKFFPIKYYDTTYQTPIYVIQGHDGSITPAFGDYRDDLLLEFEKRIYNNIKVDYVNNVFDIYNYLPGKFRTTDYSNTEFTQLLTSGFLQWVGANKVDYITNKYFVASQPFTWNYNKFVDVINGEQLLGNWRGIYKYFFDTDRPHTNPWEMLGFSEMPNWWESRYGPAPYTGGNLVLWIDLQNGYIWNGSTDAAYTDSRFARPGLTNIIPVDANGNLLSPNAIVVKSFNSGQADGNYKVGDVGPVENAWRRSSDFPFAMQQALALAKPAFYFGSLLNIGNYFKNKQLNQYILNTNLQRITPETVTINGSTINSVVQRVAGYTNWIAEYLRTQGIDPNVKLYDYLTNVNIQLGYKMAGFSDQSFMEVIAEQSSPTSTNSGVVVPKENYVIDLYKSTPTRTITYSGVIIELTATGYSVSGFDINNPYFTIIPSLANNNGYTVSVLNSSAVIYKDYQNYKVTIPYGFEFSNRQQVVDFLISYQRYLKGIGIQLTDLDPDLGVQRDFLLSVNEFLTWAQQGWTAGSVLVLSPVLNKLTVFTPSGVVDKIQNKQTQSRILDTSYNFIKYNQMSVSRSNTTTGNLFSVTANNGQTLALVELDVVEYEHVMIFDNTTVFNDVIYVPALGNRQYRLKLIGKKTGSWSGEMNPPGFVYNNTTVDTWQPGVDYLLGSLVQYKNNNYTAIQDVVASDTFNINYWALLKSGDLKTGLLPNFSYNAEKFNRFNDVDNPETLGDFHLYSDSTIAFQPRDYMTNFGIDEITQAKFYQGFIREKGTINAVDAFTAAGFNGITSNISLYEEWAMRVGEYGALYNNQYLELILSEGTFNGDPVTFTLLPYNYWTANTSYSVGTTLYYSNNTYITTGNVYGNVFTNANVASNLSLIGSQNLGSVIGVTPTELYNFTANYSPNIYTNRDRSSIYENDIQTAGYVDINTVSNTIFNIGNYSQLTANLSSVGIGYTIWAAKDPNGNWNIYRVTETNNSVIQVKYSIDNIGVVTTTNPHGFTYGDFVVIKSFDSRVDGFYQVYNIVDNYNFSVVFYGQNADQIKSAAKITGAGAVFYLQSVRIKTPTNLTAITPPQGWINNDKLWVDNDPNANGWVVYNKSTPWSGNVSLFNANMKLATGLQTLTIDTTANSQILTLSTNANIAVGNIITQPYTGATATLLSPVVNNNIAVVSVSTVTFATSGNTYIYAGVANLNANLSSVSTVSLLVGNTITQPSANASATVVSVSGNVIVVTNSFGANAFTSTGNTYIYNNGANLYANVTTVAVNLYTSNVGFGKVTAISNSGAFAAAGMSFLGNGNVAVFVANIFNANTFTQVANLGAPASNNVSNFGASLTTAGNLLYIGNPGNGVTDYGRVHIYRYFSSNNTFPLQQTISGPWNNAGDKFGSSITASSDGTWLYIGAPGVGNVYVYNANSSVYSYANTITGNTYTTNANSAQFGYVVKTTSDGRQTTIGAPYQTVNGISSAGSVYVVDRSVESFVANGATYLTKYPITLNTLKVTVNGNVLTTGFSANANAVVFSNAPVIGSIVTIDTNKVQLLQQLTPPAGTSGATFGITTHIAGNDADIYVASPGYSFPGYYSGIVYRYVNQGASYGTITSNIIAAGFTGNVSVGDSIRINGIDVVMTGTNVTVVAQNINSANIAGVTATAQLYGALTINSNVAIPYQRLIVTPGTGNAIANLGLQVYANVQALLHPATDSVNQFGSQVLSSPDSKSLVVSASQGSTQNITTFDKKTKLTTFDYGSVTFVDTIYGSGMVYVYGLVDGALSSTTNDQYVLVQRLQNNSLSFNDQFGYSLAMNANTMIVGAPGDSNNVSVNPISGSAAPIVSGGSYYVYNNFSGNIGWDIISSQQPKVDIGSVSRFYLFNSNTATLITNLDYIDPAKGKILGVAEEDLDYITAYDPAVYNAVGGVDSVPNLANSTDFFWGAEHATQTWWNIDAVRYINYEQGNLTYRANNWGRMFPGSQVQVCEWVESDQPPSAYTGSGTPLYPDNSAYSLVTTINPNTKLATSKYYYWVMDKTSLEPNSVHLNTVSTISSLIENPHAQGIPYATALRNDSISLYGVSDYLTGNSIVLHVDYDTLKNTNIIHSEYQLVQEGDSGSVVPTRIINKIKDSLSGITATGTPVTPLDANGNYVLPIQQRIGLDKNQTLFVNQSMAIENFVQYVNGILIQYPINEEFNISNLYSAAPLPDYSTYDLELSSHAELSYLDTALISSGYVVLVSSDETQLGKWTTYTWSGTAWSLTSIQSYYTPLYWSKADWYDSTYNSTSLPAFVVNTVADISTISTLKVNDIIKVLNNGNNQFVIYRVNSSGTADLVGIQNGTIQLNSSLYTTSTPKQELRIIFDTIQNDIFIDSLTTNFNSLFFFLINYILTEQPAVDWAFKTSFVTILHKLRKLSQPANYIPDNQTYYESYINEVKPYRTSIREYKIDYEGSDEYYGDTTDFDIPATYISSINGYRSPNGTGTNDELFLSTLPQYSQWYNNYTYGISNVALANPGQGYFLTPTVTVIGGGGTGANIIAHVNFSSNTISRFEVIDPGTGYTSNPTLFINGTGANAVGYATLTNEYLINDLLTTALTTNSNVTVYSGNIVSQPATGAYGTVYTSTTGNTITLTNVYGTFSTNANAYIFRDFANLQSNATTTSSYYQYINQSYNVVRNISTTLLFDRVNYSSNIIAWLPNITVQSGRWVSYNHAVYQALPNQIEYLRLASNISVPAGTILKQAITGANAVVAANVNNSNVVSVLASSIGGVFVANSNSYIFNIGNISLATNVNLKANVSSITSANTYIYSSATLTFNANANIAIAVGNYITQANATGNARVIAISSNLQLITVGNITGTYQRRGGNIAVNGISSNVRPVLISNIFDFTKYSLLNANTFTSATDRIAGYYQPGPNMPGTDLTQLMSGTGYPGVLVSGVKYNANTSIVNSNVAYAYSNIGTIFSNNISKLDFTTYSYVVGQPIQLINNDNNTTANLTIVNIQSNAMVVTGLANNIVTGANITFKYYDYNNPTYLDSIIQNTYISNFNSNANVIAIDGGAYYDTYSSHAPEELVPGATFDNLNMVVITKIKSNTATISYRVTHNMTANAASKDYTQWPQYFGISTQHTTTLTANLKITDSNIFVANAAALTAPNPTLLYPGIVYINGEKITFWTRDVVNNVLGQIRRAVDGTGAPNVHVAGSSVVECGIAQLIPGGNVVNTYAAGSAWLNPPVGGSPLGITDNFGTQIVDNFGNPLYTFGPGTGVTDGTGLENSITAQAIFIKNLQ